MKKSKAAVYIIVFLLCIGLGEFLTSSYVEKKIDEKVADLTGVQEKTKQSETYIVEGDFDTRAKITQKFDEDDPNGPDPNDGVMIKQDAKSFIWNFLGVVKSGHLDSATSFFEPNIMTQYFYQNYQAYEDYSRKLEEFGNGLTRNHTLASFDLQKLTPLQDNKQQADVRLIYNNNTEAHLQLTLQYNEEISGFMILTPVDELLKQAKP
ncbi:MAG: hypothetical protein ACQEXV_22245 [Bacillota bacterium]